MISRKAKILRRRAIKGALWTLVLGVLGYLIYLAATGTTAIRRTVTPDVAVVHLEHVLPPPPPPPPPPKQKFVPQPKNVPMVRAPEPVRAPPKPAAPPGPKGPSAAPALAVKGQGPPDSFGLAGDANGGNYLGGGGGGGGAGDPFGWYGQLLKERLTELLERERRLKGVQYRVLVQMWLSPQGAVQRTEYISTSGHPDIDRTIQQVMQRMPKLPEAPPRDMPQPVVLRLTSRAE